MTSLPNELIQHIVQFTDQAHLTPFLFVCNYTFQLARQRVYKKVIFPNDRSIEAQVVLLFCQTYGQSLETIKLPQARYFEDAFYQQILTLCPRLDFLQSNIYPKQLVQCIPYMRHATCFLATDLPSHLLAVEEESDDPLAVFQHTHQTTTYFPCCPSFLIFPNEIPAQNTTTLTQISHYFHHPGALSNAILPTFGADLLALTLNPYDVLTASIARLIVAKCPRLRYLVVPIVKAEGLWMLLRWCHTLAAIIVGYDESSSMSFDEDEEEQEPIPTSSGYSRSILAEIENERAVETIQHHKRVWCIHYNNYNNEDVNHTNNNGISRVSWHIGIIPKL